MSGAIITPDDLFLLKEVLWPDVTFYDKQVEIVESVLRDSETYVPAANMCGKDFTAGFLVVGCFTLCAHLDVWCRIITSSVTDRQLAVLWGEVDRFIRKSRVPLLHGKGGRLIYTHQRLERVDKNGTWEGENFAKATVVTNENQGEGLGGAHADWNMWIADECSGMANVAYKMAKGWAQRMLLIGNCWPCDNFFFDGVEAGDLVAS